MDVQLLTCGLAAVLLTSFAREWMHLAFGAAYRDQAVVLVILSSGLLAMASSTQSHVLQIATNARFTRNATLSAVVILFASASCLVSASGLRGAAIARAGSMLALAAATLVTGHRRWARLSSSGLTSRRVSAVGVLYRRRGSLFAECWMAGPRRSCHVDVVGNRRNGENKQANCRRRNCSSNSQRDYLHVIRRPIATILKDDSSCPGPTDARSPSLAGCYKNRSSTGCHSRSACSYGFAGLLD